MCTSLIEPAMNLKSKRILIVDDEATVTTVLSLLLKKAGFAFVETLNDPLKVTQYVLENKPDVLLLDISMPQLDGLKILEELGDLVVDDSLTVIMVTASEEEYVKRKALILGACDFIPKPVNKDELATRVENALLGRPNSEFILNSLPPRATSDGLTNTTSVPSPNPDPSS